MKQLKFLENLYKVRNKIKALLLKGVTRQKLALTIATGSIVGVFPIIGTTTIMASLAAFGLGLNQAFIQIVNYTVYPLQLLLFIPFLKMGNAVFQLTPHKVNFQRLFELMQTDTLFAIGQFSHILIAAILLWLTLSIPFSILIYYLSLRYIRRINIKI